MEKTINITLKVWRQKGSKEKGRFEEYKLNGVSTDSSFLEMLDILNLKCDPVLIASLRGTPGLLPAYHMNKEHWITAVLDGSAPDAQIQTLLAMSYDMTAPGHGRTVKKRNENQAAAAHLR